MTKSSLNQRKNKTFKMDIIDFDEEEKYTNQEIFYLIKYVMKDEKIGFFAQLVLVIDAVKHITDKNLFENTHDLIKDFSFFKDINKNYLFGNVGTIIENTTNEKDKLKLKVSICSAMFLKELFSRNRGQLLKDKGIPMLRFEFIDRKLIYNLQEILDFITVINTTVEKEKIFNLPTTNLQRNEFKKWLLALENLQYELGGKSFKKIKKHIKNIIDYLPEATEVLSPETGPELSEGISPNPFPSIFNGTDSKAFNVFDDFAKEIITDDFLDFSFIFQKMRKKPENLINCHIPHLLFMDWLFDNEYITNSVYDNFKDKASFSSKADTGNRSTRYYFIKDRHFPTDSEISE
jgi:hypothetical protein